VQRLVRLAQEHLGLDAVYVAEFVDGRQVYRALAGDARSFGLEVGDGPPLSGTYCELMVDGDIPNVIRDSSEDARVRDLPTTSAGGIAAYLGVPLRLSDGELYGTLCALSHTAQADLNPRDARFLSLVADFMVDGLASDRRTRQRSELLLAAIDVGSISTVLQPIIDLKTGRCTSFEALSRFPSALGSPEVVFRDAEQSGLRFEVEQLAVRRAHAMLPLVGSAQRIAINVSPDVALELVPLLPEDLPWHQLILEVTEHAAVEAYEAFREHLRPLRAAGLQLSVDDAGAGFASLRHVVELQPDIIKVDRSLVSGINNDAARRSAFMTFVLLAAEIDAVVVAEGVETQAELETVARLGADAVQGYLLGRPSGDAEVIRGWVDQSWTTPASARR
jgi:EAL domain-containing protein (putative c-di-GMP-specific phosphodiesterase class I)